MSEDKWSAITRARLRLMLDQPFLAAAVARLPLVDATDRYWCPTFATDGYAIYINREFAETLSDVQICFVLAHELLHCILGHIDRRQHRDPELWNVAIDYATNLLLASYGFDVLDTALFDRKWGGMTSESIYDCLEKQRQETPQLIVCTAGGNSLPNSKWREASLAGVDLHVDPLTALTDDLRPQPNPSEIERRFLRQELVSAGKVAGIYPGTLSEEINLAITPSLDWQGLLAQFVGGLRRSDFRLFPPNRKHIHRGLYLPSTGVPGPKHLVVGVDTSGSMDTTTLGMIFSQIDHLRSVSECRLTVLQFDTVIQRVEVSDPFDQSADVEVMFTVSGRGGTDIRAPFLYIENDKDGIFGDIDALIVLTDGFGEVPKQAPQYPVLWILPSHGVDSSSFGMVIRLTR